MALLQKGYLGSTPLWREVTWFETFAPIIGNIGSNVTVTANTSAHTKGSWSQLIASTSANADMIYINVSHIAATNTNTATLVDIATGASGSETVIVSDLAVGGAGSNAIRAIIPYQLPSGTRLAARIQSVVTGGKTATVSASVLNCGNYADAPTSVDVIGGNTATSQGISFSGASGTWVEGIASTSRAYRAICMVPSLHSDNITAGVTGNYGIGVGAAGSEIEFGTNRVTQTGNEVIASEFPHFVLAGRRIPAGSRIAVKHPITGNPDRTGFCLIGIP